MFFNNFDDCRCRLDIFLSQHGQHIDEGFTIHRQISQGRHIFFSDDILLRIVL